MGFSLFNRVHMVIFVIVVCCQHCLSVCLCSHGYLCYRCLLSALCVGVSVFTWLSLSVVRIVSRCVSVHMVVVVVSTPSRA